MPGTAPLKTVDTTFRIVEELWRLDGAGVTELAERMNMAKSTVHDYLRSLEEAGYAVRDEDGYHLSTKFLQIGGRLKWRMELFHVARPELVRLAEETGEEANLTIEEAGRAVIVHAERGERALNLGDYTGIHTPLHTHASGKVILAALPDDAVDRIIDRHGLERITEHTVTDRTALDDELETIAEQGYAVDVDEQVLGMGVVSAPIVDDQGARVHGAVGIVCPSRRLADEEYVQELADAVRQASNVIGINYRYGS